MNPSPSPLKSATLLGLLLLLASSLPAATLSCTLTASKGGGPVHDAVVSLIPLDQPVPPVAPDAHVEIAQEGQEFYDFVTVVQNGTKVTFPNRDTVQHHVYSLSKPKKFELPLYSPGKAESLVFESTGMVALGCNIHDWMIAYLLVVPTPWFGKSDAYGKAAVTAPPGRYRLEIWHPRLGAAVTQEIVLSEGEPLPREFSLTLKPERRIRRGGALKSGGYR